MHEEEEGLGVVEAIVLAGSKNNGGLKTVSDQAYEAFIPVAGKPMVEYVISCLQESPTVTRIILVGPLSLSKLQYPKLSTIVESTDSVMENLRLGLEKVQTAGHILVTTSDIPLLTNGAVEDFLKQSLNQDADLFYPIVDKNINEAQYPGVHRTYVKLKEGVYTGGNIFLFNSEIVDRCWDFVQKMVELRKKPVQMCAQLGWFFIFRLLLGQLSLPSLEKRVGTLLGIKAKAIISPFPEIGVDVDKADDYELVTRILAQ